MGKAHRLTKGGKKRSVKAGRLVTGVTSRRTPDRTPTRDEPTITIGHPDVGSMSSEQRRAYIELIGANVAEWSADLNRRLA